MKGQEIRLVALSAKTGALEWSQQLAVVEQPGVQVRSAFRRNAGAMPSFADGVLVCPTSAGAIVAIDLTTRSLLWGYQYPRAAAISPSIASPSIGRCIREPSGGANEHWADGSVTIADGRVLVAPVETDQLYCLNLVDGKELWKESRGNRPLYVACVHDRQRDPRRPRFGFGLETGRRRTCLARHRAAPGQPAQRSRIFLAATITICR